MKSVKTIVFALAFATSYTGTFYASLEQAVLAFGGGSDVAIAAQHILASQHSLSAHNAENIANGADNSQEALAIAHYMGPKANNYFKSNITDNQLVHLLQQLIAQYETEEVPVQETNEPVRTQEPNRSWGSFLGYGKKQNEQSNQAKTDAMIAAANVDALSAIAKSGDTGSTLYKRYIDHIFSLLQAAVDALVDTQTQQEIVSYLQSKCSDLQKSVAKNKSGNRTIGKMSKKRAAK